MPSRQRASIIASNLLVPAGVLLFGWNAAAAIFLIWLDTLIVSLQLGALILAAASPFLARPAGTHRGGWMIGISIGLAFVAPAFFAPPFMVGAELYDLLKPQFPQGPLAAAFADRLIFLWIGIEIVIRGWQVLVRAGEILQRPAAAASFKAEGLDQFLGLMFRMIVLLALAWLASWFGRPGLLLFLFAASAFFIYTDLHENWLRHLAGAALRWAEAHRARNRTSE